MKYMERMQWELTQVRSKQTTLTGISPDMGTNRIFVDVERNDKRLLLVPPCSQLVLNYAGRITMIPDVKAIFVCKAFKREFYVTAKGHDGIDQEFPWQQFTR